MTDLLSKYSSLSHRPPLIAVEIDPIAQTLRFSKNNKDLGVACSDLPMGIHFRLAVTLRNPRESVTCLPGIIDVASSLGFIPASWEASRHGKNIQLAAREATCNKTSWENCTVIANPSCTIPHAKRKGTFTWSFKVLKGHQITIGVVLPQFNPDEHDYINKTKLGWGYYQGDGKIGHGGPASKAYGMQYKVQDGKPMHVEGELAPSVRVP